MRERNEVVVETNSLLTPGECQVGQKAISYNVDLDDALCNWESDYLYGISLMVRFETFEDAKRYIAANLSAVVQNLMRIIEDVQTSETFDDLDLCCCSMITEERPRTC